MAIIVNGTQPIWNRSALAISPGILPQASLHVPYVVAFSAAGGTAPYNFQIIAGALPPGLAMTAAGAIAGTPTQVGLFSITLQVIDSSAPNAITTTVYYNIQVSNAPAIVTASLPDGAAGVAYEGTIQVSGSEPPYTVSVIGGALPPGLALASGGGITGVPSAVGTFTFVVEATDSNNPPGTAQAQFSITITAALVANPVAAINDALLLAGADGGLYCIQENQYHDQNVQGNPVGYMSQWQGVPDANEPLARLQLGGATVSAKGSGQMNITAIDNAGNIWQITTPQRPFLFAADDEGNPIETVKDFATRAIPHSERYEISFDNGGVPDAWFEIHVATLYIRPIAAARKG